MTKSKSPKSPKRTKSTTGKTPGLSSIPGLGEDSGPALRGSGTRKPKSPKRPKAPRDKTEELKPSPEQSKPSKATGDKPETPPPGPESPDKPEPKGPQDLPPEPEDIEELLKVAFDGLAEFRGELWQITDKQAKRMSKRIVPLLERYHVKMGDLGLWLTAVGSVGIVVLPKLAQERKQAREKAAKRAAEKSGDVSQSSDKPSLGEILSPETETGSYGADKVPVGARL